MTDRGMEAEDDVSVSRPDLIWALANEWRQLILRELLYSPDSPSGFVKAVGGEISTIARHFRNLAERGYLELVDERSGGRRRGGVEHFFRITALGRAAIGHALLMDHLLEGRLEQPPEERPAFPRTMSLDRRGLEELVARLADVRATIPRLQAEASRRMEVTGEEPIQALVGLEALPSPLPTV